MVNAGVLTNGLVSNHRARVGLSIFALRPRLLPPIATDWPLCTRTIPSRSHPPRTAFSMVFQDDPAIRPLPNGSRYTQLPMNWRGVSNAESVLFSRRL